jgi:hypothetical protein
MWMMTAPKELFEELVRGLDLNDPSEEEVIFVKSGKEKLEIISELEMLDTNQIKDFFSPVKSVAIH